MPISFNTQPPEGGWEVVWERLMAHISFNTQPPEGGWLFLIGLFLFQCCFNTQPPEGGWLGLDESLSCLLLVSTHSRLKAAGNCKRITLPNMVGFNTQPPEGGWT